MIGEHIVFDVIAWLGALGVTWAVYRWRFRDRVTTLSRELGSGYFISLTAGGLVGAYGFGTINTLLSGQPALGRSILGGLVGAILLVEIYKYRHAVRGSTGAVLALPFCVAIALGRIGCYQAGLDDFTHGIPSSLAWSVDFGDGVTRHPVQLYEALAMLAMGLIVTAGFRVRSQWLQGNAFYIVMGCYGLQRFLWEFLKPYATVIGPFNLYHFLCLVLIVYALLMMYFRVDEDS